MSKQYYLYCLIVFVTSSKSAKIYKIDLPDRHVKLNQIKTNNEPQILNILPSDRENDNSLQEAMIDRIASIFNKQIDRKQRKTTCDKKFGSMYGTKLQKLKCINDLQRIKNQQTHKRTTKRFPVYYFDIETDRPVNKYNHANHLHNTKNIFEDLTRGNGEVLNFADDYLDVKDLARSEDTVAGFADDYVDFDDLRRVGALGMQEEYINYILDAHLPLKLKANTITKKKCDLSGRRQGVNLEIPKGKTVTNEVVRAASEESSDSSDSSDSTEKKILKKRDKYQKPKRFQVVKNSESIENVKESGSDSDGSSSDSAKAVSDEVPKKKPKNKGKVKKPSFSDLEDKYVYVQGRNRQVDLNRNSDESDTDGRRRLPHFFPKRFHWDEDDIPNLGYYWFNGIKGKYAGHWP